MRSRLEGLTGVSDAPSTSNGNDGGDSFGHDVERHAEEGSPMSDFIEQIDMARAFVDNIESKLTFISETHEQALSAISDAQKMENQKKAEDLNAEIRRDGDKVRKILKQIADENKGNAHDNSPLGRLRRSQHAALSSKFFDAMNDYNDIQRMHKSKMRTMLGRQLKIAKPDATEDEVNSFLEDGDQNPFSFSTSNTMEMKKALEDVNQRHKELLKLEESMRELQSLFVDMAAMVEQQGALIDQIDFNINSAEQHTEQAAERLTEALTYQRKARKKQICLAVFGVVVVAAIAIALAIQFGARAPNNSDDRPVVVSPSTPTPGAGV